MAFSFGFYNAFEHDRRYNAIQISRIFDGIINDGVYATIGEAMVLKVNQEGTVVVGPGRAWFDHTWNYNDADLPLNVVPPSDILLNRYDAVVIDIQGGVNYRVNDIIWVQGTPSSNPQKPVMIKTAEHHQYPLGYIYRRANSSTISQSDIQNTVGTSECPFVTGIIETINIDTLLLQWRSEWLDFMNGYEEAANDWFLKKKEEYLEFFKELKDQSLNDYNNYIKDLNSYMEELEKNGNATISAIIKQILEFRDKNESDFLKWFKDVKELLSQYPGGDLIEKLQEVKDQQEEIIEMLVYGQVMALLYTDNNDFITDDLGTPLLIGRPICQCGIQ